MYVIRESERETLISWIDRALDMDPPLCSICIDRKVGRSTSQQGEIQADELAVLASQGGSAAILDEVVSRWGVHGGRWQMRLMIDAGEGEPKRQLKRSFDMTKPRPVQSSGSKGTAAGIEELTQAWANGFAAQVESQQSAQAASHNTMLSMLQQQQDNSLIRIQESTSYMAQIHGLQNQLTEARIELALADRQSAFTPEVMQAVLPAGVALIQAAAARLMPQLSAAEPPPSQETTPDPSV